MARGRSGPSLVAPAGVVAVSDDVPDALVWLELLHPAGPGTAPTSLVEVSPAVASAAGESPRGWLARALNRLSAELAPDGLGYVVVPRRWRPLAVWLARQNGLQIGPWLVHVPPRPGSRYLVPVEPRTLRYALGTLMPGRRWSGGPMSAMLAAAGPALLPWVLPSAGFVARRPGGRPLFDWLMRFPGPGGSETPSDPRGTAVIAAGWRDLPRTAVLHRFRDGRQRPDIVAKVAPAAVAAAHETESVCLARFGPDARRAGAAIPHGLAAVTVGTGSVLVQTAVPGRPAAVLLAARPSHLPRVAETLARWLGRWHGLTRTDRAPAGAPATLVVSRLEEIAEHLPDAEGYRRWLVARCESLSTARVPLVAAHNDLTMWNVLIDGDDGLGVVDWEHATSASLPLVDFFYALTDAVMAAGRYPDRRSALAACIGADGGEAALMTRLRTRLAAELALPPSLATLALHACWIHHGANASAERPGTPGARAFIDIVRWLARCRVEVPPFVA